MKVEYLPIDTLRPYERNAKKHPAEQVERIANSIKEFGWRQPIVIDEGNVVIIGHGRLLAAKLLDMENVPCVRASGLTETQIKALRLADNKTNESGYDFALLGKEIEDIGRDLNEYGFEPVVTDLPDSFFETGEEGRQESEGKEYECPHCSFKWRE